MTTTMTFALSPALATPGEPAERPGDRPGPGPQHDDQPVAAADWTAYLNALSNGSSNATKTMRIVQQLDAVFHAVADTTNGANTNYIRISYANLLKSRYAQSGAIEISTDGGNTTPNTADSTVMKYFVAGFDAGYWGGSGTSASPNDPSKFDLNDTWNWGYNYAYNATFNAPGSAIVYSNILGSGIGTPGGNNRLHDPWVQAVQKISNTYCWSYGDLISQGGTNPQISLWNASTSRQVSNIAVALYSNMEAITARDPLQSAQLRRRSRAGLRPRPGHFPE